MAEFVTQVDDELAREVDRLVDLGIVESRSAAVRRGLVWLVDRERRAAIGRAIVDAYRRVLQTDEELGSVDAATREMISEESW